MRFILIFLLLILNTKVFAQSEDNYLLLNQTNGLPSNYVYDAFEDNKGFIWLATDVGLYRYDGFEYRLFASEMQSSLAGSCIQQDRYGRIWYENFDGYLFYIEGGKLHQINQGNPIQFLPFGLSSNYLYVIVKEGVNVYDLKSLQLLKTVKIDWEYAEHAALIDDYFYVTDLRKVVCIDPSFNVSQTTINIDVNNGVKLVQSVGDDVAVFYRNGNAVSIYNKKLVFQRHFKLNLGGTFHTLKQLGDDAYALSTSSGLHIASFAKNEFKILGNKWVNFNIAKYFTDKNGNEWLPTVGSGVLLNPKLKVNNEVLQKGNFTNIRHFDSGFITASTEGDIQTFDTLFKQQKTIVRGKNDVAYLYKEEHSDLFMYTNNLGMFVEQGNKKRHYIKVALKQAVRLDDKYFLIAASGFYGLFRNPFSSTEKSEWDKFFTKNIFDLEDFSALKSFVRAKTVAYNNKLKTIVAGTNVGTFVNRQGVEHELKLNGNTFYVKKLVWCENVLFALTTSGDLYKITNLKTFEKVDIPENGLRLAKHHEHVIYMLGSNFLYAYSIKENKVTKYEISYNANSINDYLIIGDEFIMATVDGIVRMSLKNKFPKNEHIPFYVNALYANGVERASLANLAYDENNVRLNYSFLNYGKKNGVVVSYRLNKDAWIVASAKERDLYFQSLAPGDYTISFKVNGKEINQKVVISIAAPIWKSWWFYLLIILCIVAGMSLYYANKAKAYTKQIALLNEKIELEKHLGKSMLTSIKAQMNPHFFYNALNTIQAFIFTNDKLSANNYLAKFSKLTRLILEMSEKEMVTLTEEIDAVKMYLDLEKMRFGAKIDYKIALNNIVNADMIELPSMLVQPLVENAIKHGLLHLEANGHVSVTYAKVADKLVVTVDDNGIGRERASALRSTRKSGHNSFALGANQTRFDVLNRGREKDLYTLEIIDKYEQGVATGTLAKIEIPLN